MSFDQFINPFAQLSFPLCISACIIDAAVKGRITVGSGFHKENGRKEIVLSQNPHDLSKRSKASRRGENRRIRAIQIGPDFFVRTLGIYKGKEPAGRMKKQRKQGHRPCSFFHHYAGLGPDGFEPISNLPGISYGGRQEQELDPCGEVNHDLLPHDATIWVSQEMGLNQDNNVCP